MNNKPLVSFCIPTYKRLDLLGETIQSVLNQKYKNIEIIISDNDPEKSAEKIVKKFRSKKITYFAQKKNVGMMNNFGKTFDKSKGELIVFLGDDDPIEPDMLEQMFKLRDIYPDAGSYFGAPYLLVNDPYLLTVHKFKKGKTSMRNKKLKKNALRYYLPKLFFEAFLTYEIFDYFFWSCGMVKREIVKKVGKAHNLNGSDLLTDYAYVLRVGMAAPMAVINREVGCQRIHVSNYGRSNENLLTLQPAVRGLYNECLRFSEKNNSKHLLEHFITDWVTVHLLSILKMRRIQNEPEDRAFILAIYKQLLDEFPFLKKAYSSFTARVHFPKTTGFYEKYKWLGEKRTFVRGFQKIFRRTK